MKMFLLISCLSVLLTGCVTSEKKPDVQSSATFDFLEFRKVLSPRGQIIPLPGGQDSLIVMNIGNDAYPKLYRLDHGKQSFTLEYDAGQTIKHAFSDPSARRIFITLDKGGDENTKIFEVNLSTKTRRLVFGQDGYQGVPVDFGSDEKSLYVLSNHKNKRYLNLYKVDIAGSNQYQTLTQGTTSFHAAAISKHGRYAALLEFKNNAETNIHLLDNKKKSLVKLLDDNNTTYIPQFFSDDEKRLFFDSNKDRDRMGCAALPLDNPSAGIQWQKTSKHADFSCSYSPEGDITLVSSQSRGQEQYQLYRGIFEKPLGIKFPPRSVQSQFTVVPKSQNAIMRVSKSNDPGNFYMFPLNASGDARLQAISQLNVSKIKDSDFASSYDFDYKSFDGLSIHGIIYAHDSWLKAPIKRPVILWPHGGPDHYESHQFHPFFQYWTAQGFVVFAPNFRGSTGYGKKFETLNDRDWGGGHIKDLIWGKKAISKLPYVNKEQIFIVGASFGGFSVLSAITQYPKASRGAVAMVALANLETFMESIPKDPAWQGEFISEVGDPVKDKELYRERSPYFHAENIRTPLLIYQAENDIRTVQAEMDQFVAKLKRNRIPVTYEVLKGEGHSISKTESWQKIMEGTIQFLNRQR